MAVLKMKEITVMDAKALSEKLGELKRELSIERSSARGVGGKANPGRIRELKRTVARILTFAHAKGMKVEAKMGKAPAVAKKAEAPKKPEAKNAEAPKKPETPKAEAPKKIEEKKIESENFADIVGEVKKE